MVDMEKFDLLIDTNYVPTDEEVLQIQEYLSEPLQDLKSIEDKVTAAELHLQNLRREQAKLVQGIDKYRRLISPVRRLPADILREIFLSCLPEDRNPTMSCDEAPMLLTRICSVWRSIAMSTPRLWAALHIPVPKSGPVFEASYDPTTGARRLITSVVDARLEAVVGWMQRSGTLPLSFSLAEIDVYPPTNHAKTFLKCIAEQRSRWKNIALVCAGSSLTDFRKIPPSDVPLLQLLSIRVSRPEFAANTEELKWKDSPIFSAAGITSLSLCFLDTPLFGFPFSWSQLTHFGLEADRWNTTADTSVDDLTSILENCPNLVSCQLRLGHGSNPQHRVVFPPISLPRLESMKIYDAVQIPTFFAAILAPSLRKLEYLADGRARAAPNSSAFSRLLAGVGGNLEELIVTIGIFETDDAAELFPLCPALRTLVIASTPLVPPTSHSDDKPATISSSFLKVLNCVPNLEKFECHTEANFSDEALLEFILRKHSGKDLALKPLKSVYVLFKRCQTIDIIPLLEDQIANGLSLTLKYPPRTYRGPFSPYEGLPPALKADPYFYLQSPY
ncbi:hypothetical protein BDN70DRAFT_997256 [Pholiota conissans]|uniref:F-box domain-containing protein n=1 Tax=Pholiota conissans TaxID=109636 RepID=A0A9P5YS67_9AGAR|nr:hypothetical protein BDN70DRAFT_997256 [Pholiota conissans]